MALDAHRTQAYFALLEAGSLLRILMDEQLERDAGLTFLQFSLLAHLGQAPEGRMRLTDVADAIVHSRSGLTYQLTKLENAGLLRRERSAADERSVSAIITDEGRALLADVLPGHTAVVESGMFNGVDDRRAALMAEVLGDVRDRLRNTAPGSAERRRSRGST